ncbi:SDR family NAD(P)-dependent oxidoreductase [Nocardia sp. CDC159]|uniref:SDR family NAD(P)-dependent oxidoreductase n=1 Tax=Nocardia pulmonis TaxID=2951408 RepID=A0A9X2IWZ2_9NOCA|nr:MULTISPECIES: SDR family NAD(P)-dependent oxidoreductase [Nocardia]MCM6775462.1 SDR family NAD(P)-dependent oxidoreductase [Nocardia pulmonis]MCM6787804.1 SDR family NAD(P)-dependent oxidoreductase [Nocardia sp. CDC159]
MSGSGGPGERNRGGECGAVRPHRTAFDTDSFVRPLLRFEWEPVPAPRAPGDRTTWPRRNLLVLGENSELVAGLARVLRATGADVDECSPDTRPARTNWDGIVDLNVTGVPYRLEGVPWQAALARTTRMLQHRYPDWSIDTRADHCWYLVVTELGGRMAYDDSAPPQPLGGIWAGLAKSLPRELPNVAVKVLDVDRSDPDVLGAWVIEETTSWDLYEIGYRDGVRYALTARRREVGPPRFDLTGDDLVLISGGARGVGFALARGLAETTGCRVVVTGRSRLPVDEPWLSTDEDDHRRRCRRRIAACRTPTELRDARAAERREVELRMVHANLETAAAAGLRIDYIPCDVADPDQVAALFARLPAPTVIVHNAGVDKPKRLDHKDPGEVVHTVHVKAAGFANLVRAVLAHPDRRATLRVFCNVGSLAGRMSGMIGQLDYAAGNEALARLGSWARNTHGLPVQTICWPTWERLGVIANYDAAVRYVSTVDPADGVRRWIAEIRAGTTREVMFIGQVGTALVPSQLRGFWLFTGHPDLPRLHALAFFLGRVVDFEPFRQIRSVVGYRAGHHPCLAEFRVAERPALPVSVLLEQMCSVADWVVPEGWPPQHLADIRDIVVDLSELILEPGRQTRFTTHATGARTDDAWVVTVRVETDRGARVGSARLRYLTDPPELAPVRHTETENVSATTDLDSGGRSPWTGLLFERPRWVHRQGWYETPLPALSGADLWTTPYPPQHGIAPAAIEAAIRSVHGAPEGELRIQRIVAAPGAQQVDHLRMSAARQLWTGERDGETVLRIDRITVDRTG